MKTGIIEAVGVARIKRHHAYREEEILREHVNAVVRKLRKIAASRWLPDFVRDRAAMFAFQLRPLIGGTASNAAETDILALIFNATAWADLAQDDGSSPATTITIALHTTDPGEAGNQSTSEAAYTDYARQTVARDSGGFTVSGGSATLVANLDFPTSGAAGSTITHFSVGTGVSNYMIASGAISPTIPVGAAGVTPRLTTATAVTCD